MGGAQGGLLCTLGQGSPSSLCVVGCHSWTLSSSYENHSNSGNDTIICLLMSTYYVRLPRFSPLDPTALSGRSCY